MHINRIVPLKDKSFLFFLDLKTLLYSNEKGHYEKKQTKPNNLFYLPYIYPENVNVKIVKKRYNYLYYFMVYGVFCNVIFYGYK